MVLLQLNKGSPRELESRLEMGSPNNVDVVTGTVKIPDGEISAEEWCRIIEFALREIGPHLKYVAGFKPLSKLLNGKPVSAYGCFTTPSDAMPSFSETGLSERTRFVALQMMEPVEDNGKSGHEITRSLLLLTDTGRLVVLKLSFFKQKDAYVVCGSSLEAEKIMEHPSWGELLMLGCIKKRFIHPRSVIDKLYLLFEHTISDREKRLDPMRRVRDRLQQMYYRVR